MDDFELLRQYSEEGSQAAFQRLVDRYLRLVYSAAKRQVRSPDLAKDVSQSAFLELARQATQLRSNQPLGPWLYVVTRRKAIDLMRREGHRRTRERAAAEAAALESTAAGWIQLEPVLDEAMEALGREDRQAVVLRYFENRSLREVGNALGVSDDAAQKRVSRALERLRDLLGRRGIAATAAGLATEITAHAGASVPVGLGASISAAIGTTTLASSSAPVIAMTLLQKSLLAVVLLGAAGALFHEHRIIAVQNLTIASLQSQTDSLRRQLRDRSGAVTASGSRHTAAPIAADVANGDPVSAALGAIHQQIAHLKELFARDPSQRIPEMGLLTPQGWINVAARNPDLKTDLDWRRAMAYVRSEAEGTFGDLERPALKAYLQANRNQLPTDVAQLGPYFDPPIDPAIFTRYQMLQTGDASAPSYAPFGGYLGVKISALPDQEYDLGVSMSVDNFNGTDLVNYAGMLATIAYRTANQGRSPEDPSEVVPYFSNPEYAQKYLQRKAANKGQVH